MKSRINTGVFVAALAMMAIGLLAGPALANRSNRVTPVVKVVRQASPAVVNISTRGELRASPYGRNDPFFDRFFQDFYGPAQRTRRSLGSGVIIDGNAGLIATNHHVIAQASQIRVQLADKRVFMATVVGADPGSDLAVLRITSPTPLPQVKLGDSDDVMIGEQVIAIGNPYGLSHTVTTGVVSAVDRRVPTKRAKLSGLIQIDASINPGNSGGPLLNVDGEVIGINTAIFRRAQGIGFAIGVNQVRRIVADLVRYGEVVPAWLGLDLQTVTPHTASAFGLKRSRGVVVVGTMKSSPADKAGLKRGVVIEAMNGHRVKDAGHYLELLGQVRSGQKVDLAVLDKGKRREVKLTAKAFPLELANGLAWKRLGIRVAAMTRELAYRHRARENSAVAVTEVRAGSQAAQFGLKPGDLLQAVGGQPTASLHAFQREMARNRLRPAITILVRRGRSSANLTLSR